jgi:hypothetical protein
MFSLHQIVDWIGSSSIVDIMEEQIKAAMLRTEVWPVALTSCVINMKVTF